MDTQLHARTPVRTDIEQNTDATISFLLDHRVTGLDSGIGQFVKGLGPGPDGAHDEAAAKQIPIFLQILDARTFGLSFRAGDETYQVLANDQNRFDPPRSLPPILALLAPHEEENPTGSYVIARHAYSDGAFHLLHDLVQQGFRFTLKEFLRLCHALCEALAFLHSHGVVHGQWNPRSIVCIPEATRGSPFEDARSYRYHVLNSGVRYSDPLAIPPEFLERGYFPPEIFPPSTQLPDYEAYDLETDVYCLTACLKDIFQRATSVEELTKQAAKIRDYFYRESIRKGREPAPSLIQTKEQEILDHLYTMKVKTEELIQSGLRDRRERPTARKLAEETRDLYEKTNQYADHLFEIGFEPVNVFGAHLQHYVPYQISVEPARVNSFEDSIVTLSGEELPYEVVRVTLGDTTTPLSVLEGTPTRIRVRVPSGSLPGTHQILINNRRTNRSLQIIVPEWEAVFPDHVRRPWAGFGNILVRVSGRDLPLQPSFVLAPDKAGSAAAAPPPGRSGPVHGATEAEEHETEEVAALKVQVERPSPGSAPSATAGGEQGAAGDEQTTLGEPGAGAPPTAAEPEHDSDRTNALDPASAGAVNAAPGQSRADRGGPEADGALVYAVQFPPDAPIGPHRLHCNGLDTGLRLTIEEALPDPSLERDGLSPVEVLNHREQKVHLRGRNFHASMVVDLGETVPPDTRYELKLLSERTAILTLPAGFPAGEHPVRINRAPSGLTILVRQPAWASLEPRRILLGKKGQEPQDIFLTGQNLPAVDEEAGDVYELKTRWGRPVAGAVLRAEEVERGSVHRVRVSPDLRRGIPRLHFNGWDTGLKLRVRRRFKPATRAAALLVIAAALAIEGLFLVERSRPRIESVEDARIFNFGDPAVVLAGARVSRVILTDERGSTVKDVPAVKVEGPPSEKGELYQIAPGALRAGSYRLVPAWGFLRGRPAPSDLQVVSPRFEVAPRRLNRLLAGELTLNTAGGYPLQKVKTLVLSRRASEEKRPDEKPGQAKDSAVIGPAPPIELAVGPAGKMRLKRGTFTRVQEGDYEARLDGVPLTEDLSADGAPIVIRVGGPKAESISPNPATLAEGGTVHLTLRGEDLPAGTALALIRDASRPEAAFRLPPLGDGGYEGPAEPGQFGLAWDSGSGELEVLPDLALEVYPPPQVTEVSPLAVEPQQPVELTLHGINLKEAQFLAFKPLEASGDAAAVRVPVDPQRLRQEGSRAEYLTEALAFETGKYAILPGEKAVLEVVEDCRKLLEAYRTDAGVRERLVGCLKGGRATEEVRRQGAELLFDQGLFSEAMDLYRELGDLKSRFRAAFLARFLGREAQVKGRAPAFAAQAGDLKTDPYYRAAAALGWVAGDAAPPADASGTWDLDFVRGSTAADPRAAIEALTLSIGKKAAAAAGREVRPFEPARRALAGAQLRLSLALLKEGHPLAAREHLQKSFFDSDEAFNLLPAEDQARCSFYWGHSLLWTSGDVEQARKALHRGSEAGGGTEHGALCSLYLRELGEEGSADAGAAAGEGSWEASFIKLYRFYRQVRELPNYNILTEKYEFGSPIYPQERKESLDLHQLVKRLESAQEVPDPFVHHAVLYYLRNAQRLSWPRQDGGSKAEAHRRQLLSLPVAEAAPLRDFYLLEADVRPLETAQVALLGQKEIAALQGKALELQKTGLEAALLERLTVLQRRLQRL